MHAFRNVATLSIVVLLAGSLSGCFVFDEIDNAGKFSPPSGKKTAPAQGAAGAAKGTEVAAANGAAKGPVKSAVDTAKNWWATATTLSSEENTDEIVACKLPNKIEFSLREDCLARGGTID